MPQIFCQLTFNRNYVPKIAHGLMPHDKMRILKMLKKSKQYNIQFKSYHFILWSDTKTDWKISLIYKIEVCYTANKQSTLYSHDFSPLTYFKISVYVMNWEQIYHLNLALSCKRLEGN